MPTTPVSAADPETPSWSLGARLRAAFVVFHVAAVTLAAVPTPAGTLTEQNRARPWVAESLEAGARPLIALGLASDLKEGTDLLWAAGHTLVGVKEALATPFQPYYRATGTGGMWRMFASVPTRVGRLEIVGERGGETIPLYVELTPDRWFGRFLDEGRVRSLRQSWSIQESRGKYRTFARWIADRALEEHPDLDTVRVRYRSLEIEDPARIRAQGAVPLGSLYWELRFERGRTR